MCDIISHKFHRIALYKGKEIQTNVLNVSGKASVNAFTFNTQQENNACAAIIVQFCNEAD